MQDNCPANNPVIIESTKNTAMKKILFEKESDRFLSETELKAGNKSSVKIKRNNKSD